MSKFNTASKGPKTLTKNRAGGDAYRQSPKLELVSLLLTSFLAGDSCYEKESDRIARLVSLVNAVPIDYAMRAIVYARNVFGMRSVTHIAASEIALRGSGNPRVKTFLEAVVRRPDDVLEILAYHINTHGKTKLTNAMRKGLGKRLSQFDGYQIAKYRKDSAAVSMIDAVRLLHANSAPINALMKGTLKAAETWETKSTQAGGDQDAKSEAWRELVLGKRMGYFALLRNIRNVLENAPEVVNELCAQLTNREKLRKSLVLPFRLHTAYAELRKTNLPGVQNVFTALGTALDYSCDNVPKLDGETLVVLDESGSMGGQPMEIGSLFSAVLVKALGADFMKFASTARYEVLNTNDSTLTMKDMITRNLAHTGTNFDAPFFEANKAYDRIFILSDMQGWASRFGRCPKAAFSYYKSTHDADPYLYSFDLKGYGDMQFPERNVACLAGFSDKIFDFIKTNETDKNALVRTIEQYTFPTHG